MNGDVDVTELTSSRIVDKNNTNMQSGTSVFVEGYGACMITERVETDKVIKYSLQSI